ncbi:MAG: sugar nucleotide-binding protein [Bacteroidetes bacterium]|nr:sugar nucleotide-binding protein [Bacteroidota bacterium]
MSFVKRPIIVIGSKGMLGQMVVSYFTKRGFNVIPVTERFEEDTKWDFIDAINQYDNGIIFNCVGRIKQKTENEKDLLWSNTILPLALVHHLKPAITIVHPSTDCVFDAHTNIPYPISAVQNATDSYGWSKRLAEVVLKNRKNTFIIRVSIIGPDKNPHGKGLLAWFLSNKPKSSLKGFTNHLWNGITTLEWCKQIEEQLKNHDLNAPSKLLQLGTRDHLSKYHMLELFQKFYSTDYKIDAFEAAEKIDRRLEPVIICKSLKEQLTELVNYNL